MRRAFRLWACVLAALVLAIGALVGVGTAYAESNGGVRVMPLGDSITDGATVPGGYRIGLWQRFVNAGYRVDFVGSLSNGPASLGDHDHEGHSGWRIDQIDANIAGWLHTSTPHTVLLHIGTNDVLQNYDLANAPARLSALIDHITANVPTAEVFVATIIPLGGDSREANVRTFNAAIPGIVQSKAGAGEHVHLVDMHAALTAADLVDGVHPNATGYDKMAATWYTALKSVPGSIGDAGGGGATSGPIRAVGAGRCLDVPNASQTNGTQTQIWDCNGGSGQTWTSSGGRLTVYNGAKCLDAYDNQTTAGTKVEIWDCNGGANQQWQINTDGTITGTQSGLCLDVTGASTTNGTPLELWPCNGGSNQKWSQT
ncbi:SGNH/GDSL hydrolase family protein [Actinoallomurus acanthiterrae]